MIAEIKELLIRNFLSFGDYDTIIRLDGLRSCLITGQILGVESEGEEDSNGAGKSTFVNAILWCLFGKTMHSENPGDKVVNWVTKKDCLVRITFKNDDTLSRTRKGIDGHDEILYHKSGESDITLGTNLMQQRELNRLLNLDYAIFRGSVFFAQYGKSWMEMSDVKRREALEREFHLDRIQLYADYAKEKKQEAEKEQEKLRVRVTTSQHTITTLKNEVRELEEASATFDSDKQEQLSQAQQRLDQLVASRDEVVIPDIEVLRTKWVVVAKAFSLLSQKEETLSALDSKRRQLTNDIVLQEAAIKRWSTKVDKICGECDRPFDSEYIGTKTDTPIKQLTKLKADLATTSEKATGERQKIGAVRSKLEVKQPSQTVREAEGEVREWQRREQAVKGQQTTIAKIQATENKYGASIERIAGKIDAAQKIIDETLEQMRSYDHTILHWNYIYKVYSDRRKIKGRILREFIPYLNERVNHYLDRFGMKLRIEFTDGMGVRSNYWGYEFFCGGERKRVDVAIMLAMFDLHNLMYGRQCNVVVLDEVDGRLDKKGARLLADIVRNDIASKVDSVLIISHRLDMRGAFESEIKIQKDSPEPEGLSRLLEVVT